MPEGHRMLRAPSVLKQEITTLEYSLDFTVTNASQLVTLSWPGSGLNGAAGFTTGCHRLTDLGLRKILCVFHFGRRTGNAEVIRGTESEPAGRMLSYTSISKEAAAVR